jgi:hypothetical protein
MFAELVCRDADFQKFNDRAEEFQQLRTQFKQVELHLESYQKTFEQMSEDARYEFHSLFMYPEQSIVVGAIDDKTRHWRPVFLYFKRDVMLPDAFLRLR